MSRQFTGPMEVNLSPDLEGKLARAAGRRGVSADVLIREAIERAVDYDDWFIREVEKGLAQIDVCLDGSADAGWGREIGRGQQKLVVFDHVGQAIRAMSVMLRAMGRQHARRRDDQLHRSHMGYNFRYNSETYTLTERFTPVAPNRFSGTSPSPMRTRGPDRGRSRCR